MMSFMQALIRKRDKNIESSQTQKVQIQSNLITLSPLKTYLWPTGVFLDRIRPCDSGVGFILEGLHTQKNEAFFEKNDDFLG